jgi:hypothetical protein
MPKNRLVLSGLAAILVYEKAALGAVLPEKARVAAKKWGWETPKTLVFGMEGATSMEIKTTTGPPGRAVPKAKPLAW